MCQNQALRVRSHEDPDSHELVASCETTRGVEEGRGNFSYLGSLFILYSPFTILLYFLSFYHVIDEFFFKHYYC